MDDTDRVCIKQTHKKTFVKYMRELEEKESLM